MKEPVLIVYLDQAVNQAVHGNIHFEQNQFDETLVWYQNTLPAEHPPSWAAWNAACASAASANDDKCKLELAFNYLNHAIDLGYCDLDHIADNEHMTALKDDPRWESIINQLNSKLST